MSMVYYIETDDEGTHVYNRISEYDYELITELEGAKIYLQNSVWDCSEDQPASVAGYFYCETCGGLYYIVAKPMHTYDKDEGVISVEGTCTTHPYKTYTCTVCSETYTIEDTSEDLKGHQYVESKVVVTSDY